MKTTPLHINLLIHYHCIRNPYPHCLRAPSVIQYTEELLNHGLIAADANPSGYITTKKGAVALLFLQASLAALAQTCNPELDSHPELPGISQEVAR